MKTHWLSLDGPTCPNDMYTVFNHICERALVDYRTELESFVPCQHDGGTGLNWCAPFMFIYTQYTHNVTV